VPLFEPTEVGLKTTEIMQEAPALRAPQVLAGLIEKSPPWTEIIGAPVVPLPEFDRLKTKGALALLISTEAKSFEVGVSLSAAPVLGPPSPASAPPSFFVPVPPHPAAISAPAKPSDANRSQ